MEDLLRHVALGDTGYELVVRDTHRLDRWCRSIVHFIFQDADGTVLFSDFMGCSPLHAIDSDATLRGIIGFVSLRPGDTDADYFADYTADQLRFCAEDAEYVSMWSDEAYGMRFAEIEGEES